MINTEDNKLIEDDDEESDFIPESKDNASISFKIEDRSIKEIISLFHENRIVIDTDYQRNFVWLETKQLRLIDSIFIGMPIPPIWLVRRADRKMEIVDGIQRINTIIRFVDNKLLLKNMTKKEINNKKYEDLSNSFKYDFLDSSLKLAIINDETYSEKDFIYELFKRINQNTEPLTKQELRNATYLSDFNKKIKEFSKNDETVQKIIPDQKYGRRMKNLEMFYRFLSIFKQYNEKTGKVENLLGTDQRVTSFMNEAKNFDTEETNYYISILKDAIDKVYIVFKENSFKKWDEGKFKLALNVPLMEMQLIVLNKFDKVFLKNNANEIINLYKELFGDEDFTYSLRAATDSQENTNKRLKKFQNKLNLLMQ